MQQHTISEVKRADALYDHMPLHEVSEVMGIPYATICHWSRNGWINTDRCFSGERGGSEKKASMTKAVHLVHERGMLQKEAAERMGVAPSTISTYLSKYAGRKD